MYREEKSSLAKNWWVLLIILLLIGGFVAYSIVNQPAPAPKQPAVTIPVPPAAPAPVSNVSNSVAPTNSAASHPTPAPRHRASR